MPRRLKCKAKTQAGRRCKHWAITGTERCAQHTEVEEHLATVSRIGKPDTAPVGRPPALTPPRKEEVVRLLSTTGLPLRAVAAAVNVHVSTLTRELKLGSDVRDAYDKALLAGKTPKPLTPRENGLYEFYAQCEAAQVQRDIAAAATVAKLTTQAKSEDVQGRMAIWRLERRYEEYVPLQRSVIDATLGGSPEPIKIIVGIDPDAV